MALVLADRVQETTVTTGTADFTLGGAVTGFQSFFDGIGNTNTCYYTAFLPNTSEWEVGVGVVTGGTTLERISILRSSTGGKIDFSAGQKFVFVTYPAEKSVNLDTSGNVSALGVVSSGTWEATPIEDTYLETITTAGKVDNSSTTATAENTASAIVARDESGDFSAGTITAALDGNATSADVAANVEGGSSGQLVYQTDVDTTGFLSTGTAGQALVSQGAGQPPTWGSAGVSVDEVQNTAFAYALIVGS